MAPLTFDEFWLTGPWRKVGKKDARRHWNATVKTEADVLAIIHARDLYYDDLRRCRARGFAKDPQHGSTWFNNWQDWLAEEVEARADEAPERGPAWSEEERRENYEAYLRDLGWSDEQIIDALLKLQK